jgi:hypothetical protein
MGSSKVWCAERTEIVVSQKKPLSASRKLHFILPFVRKCPYIMLKLAGEKDRRNG